MSLLGWLFGDNESNSSSSSSTTQTTNNINPFTVAGSQGVSVSSVNTGGGFVTNNVSNTTLDGAVAVRAMDNMLTSNQDSLLFASDAQKQAYKFSGGIAAESFDFANSSMEFAKATTQAAQASTKVANDQAQLSMMKALEYSGKQTGIALDSLTASADMIKDSYADAKGRGALTDYMLMAAIGGAVLVAVYAINKG